jgi:very-short-patch-repair endonuclease
MRASKTELKVSGILDGMGINHQHGGSILTYSTDFVLTSASGARLNLEVDGDAFHRVRVVGESAKTAERTLRDVFRDRVLNKAGIETVRFFISEFDHLTHRDKEKFLWGLLKDFLRQDRVHGI